MQNSQDNINELTEKVIGAAIEVHRRLGPGLLESAYEACLAYELSARGIPFERQVELPVKYKEVEIDCGYRIDILVDKTLILELKASEGVLPIHRAQILTYMQLFGCKYSLLINFNVMLLKDGIQRFIQD